jgi:hypothetical protein
VVLVKDLLGVEPLAHGTKAMEDLVLHVDDRLDARAEIGPVHVAQPDGQRPADLVAVARADAAQRGADRLAAGALLVQQAVFLEVPGEDHMGPIT